MNWLAIIVAIVVNMVLGAIWFAPPVLGKKWQELEGRQMTGGNVGAMTGLTAVGALVSAVALAWFIDRTATNTLVGGGLVGLYAGLGFVAPALFADNLFNQRKGALYLIVAGYPVVGLLVMGAILGVWR